MKLFLITRHYFRSILMFFFLKSQPNLCSQAQKFEQRVLKKTTCTLFSDKKLLHIFPTLELDAI